ncbi:MAG: tetratricopeptide repeat protein [Candidatus Paceibacterota bacterium]
MNEHNIITGSSKLNPLDKVTYYILFLVSLLAPIFFLPISFISNQFGTSLLFGFGIILATLIYISKVLFSGSISIEKNSKYLLGLFVAVPVVYILAGIANGFQRMTFLGYTFDISTVGFILLSFIYVYLISIFFNQKNRIVHSYLAFAVSFAIISLFIIVRMIFGVTFLSFGIFENITSTVVGSWNNLGIFFGIATLLSVFTLSSLKLSKLIKSLLVIWLILSVFFLILVNFSSLWLILSVVSFLLILYGIFSQRSESSKKLWEKVSIYPAIIFIISLMFLVWGSTLGAWFTKTFNIVSVDVRPSLSVTLDIAKNTIKNEPIFGSGPNTFTTQWLSYRPLDIISTIYWNADFAYGIGLIPTFAVTTGLAGVISWVIFFGLYLSIGIKSIFYKYEDLFLKYLVSSSFFISLYLWLMSFVYVPSVVILILTFFFTGLFFASLYVSGFLDLNKKIFINNPKTGFIFSLILVATFVSVLWIGYGLFKNSESLWYFQKSTYAINTEGDVDKAESLMASAIKTVNNDIYYRALSEIQLIKLNTILSQDQSKVSKEIIQSQAEKVLPAVISNALAARNADPLNYLNWVSLGQAYTSATALGVQGAYEGAQASFSEAMRRNPNNPAIFLLLSRLEINRNNLDGAKNWALQAIQLKQNYLEAYYLLSQIEVANKNLKGAIDSVTAASIINPSDPNIFFQLGLLKYNNNDLEGAKEALEKSVTLAPDYANAKYFLGLSFERLGDRASAIKQFEEIKVSNPENEEVNSILADLKAGNSIFENTKLTNPEKREGLPLNER